MSTTIEWTQRPGTKGETWNPTTGCNKVSQGCKNCYAEVMHKRLRAMHQPKYQRAFLDGAVPHYDTLSIPLGWKKPRTVFVNSMSDLFHKDVPFAFIDQVFAIMALCPQHTFIILTKRPERMAEFFSTRDRFAAIPPTAVQAFKDSYTTGTTERFTEHQHPLPNVWLGTSVEDQATADERIPHLLRCPAAVRFLSCEPLLGHVDLLRVDAVPYGGPKGHRIDCIRKGFWSKDMGFVNHSDLHDTFGPLHWVIVGGESGHNARPMHPDWARSLRDQCAEAGVPFFFKQWGAFRPMELSEVHLGYDAVMVSISAERRASFGYQMPHQLECYITSPVTDYGWQRPMLRVGKHASGNLLDGKEHNAFPA